MKLAVVPTPETVQKLLEGPPSTPVVMVNLLRYKEKADPPHESLTGAEAYGLYAESMRAIVEGYGGRFRWKGRVDSFVMGEADEPFHDVALVEYPSRSVFLQVMQDPRVHRIADLRQAGLAGQWLIATTAQRMA